MLSAGDQKALRNLIITVKVTMKIATDELTRMVIGKAIEVHRFLGPGLLESSYQKCLAYELIKAGLDVEEEKPLPLVYKEVKLDCGYRLDLLVENCLVIEIKSAEAITPIHVAQLITYLRLTGSTLGLLLNFNVQIMKDGIRRIVNNHTYLLLLCALCASAVS